jgi:hypothetical protein
MKSYPTIKSGQFIETGVRYRMACCDCGLVHELEFKIENGKVYMRAFRNNRSTSALRRNGGFGFRQTD